MRYEFLIIFMTIWNILELNLQIFYINPVYPCPKRTGHFYILGFEIAFVPSLKTGVFGIMRSKIFHLEATQ